MALMLVIARPELIRLTRSFLKSKMVVTLPVQSTPSLGDKACSTGTSQLLWLESVALLTKISLILDLLVWGA